MHEVALAHSVADIVAEEAQAAGATRVLRVTLSLGALSHVDPDALAFSFEVAAQGGPAEGADLRIVRPPGQAFCMGCGTNQTVTARGEPCGACGGHQLLVVSGEDMRVQDLEVA
jgi:hydrogenase nickel incorporation protein HypA/HybF